MLPFFSANYYYIIIGLQAICAIHCLRKGTQQKWIWLIIFLPLIGCLIYIFTEMFTRRDVQNVQSGLGAVLNPGGNVKRLEENLRFADTFANRVALADAYLHTGKVDRAIELYESSLTDLFDENEHVIAQLIVAYYMKERYADIIPLAKKIYNRPQFARSRIHTLYAIALDYAGQPAEAEKEFKKMNGKYSYFEARYHYGLFLRRAGRADEAQQTFTAILEEESHLTPRERRYNREWFGKVKEEVKKAGNSAVR